MLKLLTAFLVVGCCLSKIPFDLSQRNKYNDNSIVNTACNKDTQIDFFLSSDSTFSPGATTPSGLSSTYMKFLDISGNELTLPLNDARVVNSTYVTATGLAAAAERYYFFRFQSDGASHTVYVLVPLRSAATTSTSGSIINPAVDSTGYFGTFNNVADGKSLPMTAFKFLNAADYGWFYTVTNSAKTETLLLNSMVIRVPSLLAPNNPAYTFSPDYANSGNKLCYGSN